MKRTIILSIMVFGFSNVFSQTQKYALMFGIADNFQLTSFNMNIAGKKILDEKHQLRLYLSPKIIIRDTENKSNAKTENKNNDYSLGIGLDYLWILLNNNDIDFFSGTGLFLTYKKSYTKNIAEWQLNSTIQETSVPGYTIGIRGTIGVEWKVRNNIGIHSEYFLSATYEYEKQENSSNISTTINSFTLGSGLLFGVSIYF